MTYQTFLRTRRADVPDIVGAAMAARWRHRRRVRKAKKYDDMHPALQPVGYVSTTRMPGMPSSAVGGTETTLVSEVPELAFRSIVGGFDPTC